MTRSRQPARTVTAEDVDGLRLVKHGLDGSKNVQRIANLAAVRAVAGAVAEECAAQIGRDCVLNLHNATYGEPRCGCDDIAAMLRALKWE